MSEIERTFEEDYDRATVEMLASEFYIEKKRLPTPDEINSLTIGFAAGIKFMNELIEVSNEED